MVISERAQLSKQVLLALADLLFPTPACVHDNLLQTAVDGCEGGRRGATTTSGLADSKGRGSRADERNDTSRSDRSHGPHSGGGVSRRGGKNR
jgi:hypothetical protein